MNNLRSYFATLSRYEGKPNLSLVSQWKPEDVNSITNAFRTACDHSQIAFDVDPNTSTPALGNKVAGAFSNGINKVLPRYSLCDCRGHGYPDQLLKRRKDGRRFAFELKAKTSFKSTDANRVVLTSTSRKLRRHFSPGEPICHVLATVFYSKSLNGERNRITVVGLRLDFLPPGSPVETRLEASVNPRLLLRGRHPNRLLVPRWFRKHAARNVK